MKINLIFFLPNFCLGGAGNSIIKMCNKLNKKKYNIYLISIGKNYYKNSIKRKNIFFFEMNISRTLFSYFELRKIVRKIISTNQAKNIFISNIHYTNIISVLCLRKITYLKLILVERTSLSELRMYRSIFDYIKNTLIKLLIKILYRFADKVISNSYTVGSDLKILTNKKVEVINPPSIKKIEKFKNKDFKKNLNILYVGRLSWEKGVNLIIKALPLLKFNNYKLWIVGIGSEYNFLKKLSTTLKLNNKVKFFGYKSNTSFYYKKANLFINSSFFEGQPNALIEAINFSLPVICSDSRGGNLDIVKNGKGGLLFKSGDFYDLSKKINFFYKNKHQLIKKIKYSRKFLNNYLEISSIKKYEKIFKEI